jgi:hypothetical protein
MWAAVKPGGVLAVEDADFEGSFCEPANEGFAFYVRSYMRVVERWGGDAALGRKLYGYFLAAGIAAPLVRAVQGVAAAGEAKALPVSTLEATAEAILAEGLATDDELREALTSLSAYAADPTSLLSEPRVFQVWSRRAVGL